MINILELETFIRLIPPPSFVYQLNSSFGAVLCSLGMLRFDLLKLFNAPSFVVL
jgi:hypothetical protein